jgi:hypothetical protein
LDCSCQNRWRILIVSLVDANGQTEVVTNWPVKRRMEGRDDGKTGGQVSVDLNGAIEVLTTSVAGGLVDGAEGAETGCLTITSG